MAERVTFLNGGHNPCRRPIKMSPLCQLEMTLPGGFPGGVGGDGSADERWGADAAGSAARSGSEAVDDEGGGAAARARAASGVPVVEGLSERRRDGLDLAAPRAPKQTGGGPGAAGGR